MKLETPPKVAQIEYVLAPWHLKVRWWLEERFWLWCQIFAQEGAESPEQANPFWWRR